MQTNDVPVEFALLMSEGTIGQLSVPNRIVFQPHHTALGGTDGMPTADLQEYYVERARGGAGLIIDGGLAVMSEGMMARRFIRAWDDAALPGYEAITSAVHEAGGLIVSN